MSIEMPHWNVKIKINVLQFTLVLISHILVIQVITVKMQVIIKSVCCLAHIETTRHCKNRHFAKYH